MPNYPGYVTATTNYTAVWTNWVVTAASITDFAWSNWNDTTATFTFTRPTLSDATYDVIPNAAYPVTPEEQEEQQARIAEARQAKLDAKQRSLELLLSLLSEDQLAEYNERSYFTVEGSSGRTYKIVCEGQTGNVQWWADGAFRANFCAHPGGDVPDPDAWLAQKLALEADDEAFLLVANIRRGFFPADSARAQLAVARAA